MILNEEGDVSFSDAIFSRDSFDQQLSTSIYSAPNRIPENTFSSFGSFPLLLFSFSYTLVQ